jgi:hypothetical protein
LINFKQAMKGRIETEIRLSSGLVMILALLWLTVSTPFIYAAQQQVEKAMTQEKPGDSEDVPLTNSTEEKTENGPTTISEYLQELSQVDRPFIQIAKLYKCHAADIYFEYKPELISPPPEA